MMADLTIKHRASGHVDPSYYAEKKEMEKNWKKGGCMFCQKPLEGRQRKYHPSCWEPWFAKHNPRFFWDRLVAQVLKRDNYTCVKCGRVLLWEVHRPDGSFYLDYKVDDGSHYIYVIDHITPIALHGDEFDLANLQTLCEGCNKIKTKEDARNIAAFRRRVKERNRDHYSPMVLFQTLDDFNLKDGR